MNSEEESALEVEIEALKAIYIHELTVDRSESNELTSVKVSLHPATADNADEQYVRLDLVFNVPAKYPDALPEICIRNPRGLSDEKIEKIQTQLLETAESNVGSAMLYELIEVAKDHLTEENVPCCQCTICLYGFVEGDVFTKTQCYHYFHSHCLARYIRHALEQISKEEQEGSKRPPLLDKAPTSEVLCPVCRLPTSPEDMAERDYPPPVEMTKQPDFSVTPEMLRLQREMAELYLRQQSQGGIINVDAEKKKFLLEISSAPESSAGGTIEVQRHHHYPTRTPCTPFTREHGTSNHSATEGPLQSCSSYPSHQDPPRRDHHHHQHHRRPAKASHPPRHPDEWSAHDDRASSSAERNHDDSSSNAADGEGPSRKNERQYRSRKPFGRGYRQPPFKQAHHVDGRNNFDRKEQHEWNGVVSYHCTDRDHVASKQPAVSGCENGGASSPRQKKTISPRNPPKHGMQSDSNAETNNVFGASTLHATSEGYRRRQDIDAYGHQHHGNHRGRSYGRKRDNGQTSRRGHAPPEACRSADSR